MYVTSKEPIPHELRTITSKDDVYARNYYLDESNSTDERIITVDATTLFKEIKDKQYTTVQVLKAFSKRAAVAHQLPIRYLNTFSVKDLKWQKHLTNTTPRQDGV